METKGMAHDIDDDLYFGGGMPDDYKYDGDEEPEEYEDDYTDEDWLEAESNQAETLYFNS